MKRYQVFEADKSPVNVWDSRPTVGNIGVYEVRKGIGKGVYIVICPPEMRKFNRWNGTRFREEAGNLEPADDDVVLDPYHMCLLYELHEELTSKENHNERHSY